MVFKNKTNLFKMLKNSLRLKLILLIAIMLSFNSFAWFIYSTKVSNSITTNVKAWRIDFEFNENEVTEYINFDIDSIYPGMDDYVNFINVVNYGETDAVLMYELVSVTILGTVYNNENYTSQEMIDILNQRFPFLLEFELTNSYLEAHTGNADFKIKVSWAYESGDDEIDTYWGHQSYLFKQKNPEESGISIIIKLSANQRD